MSELVITAVSMVTPVGLDAEQTFGSVRARISRTAFSPPEDYFGCAGAEPEDPLDGLVCARLPAVPVSASGADRIVPPLVAALRQVVAGGALGPGELKATGLFLAVAAPERQTFDVAKVLPGEMLRRAEVGPMSPATLFPLGHAGALVALSEAASAIAAGKCRIAVVGGADSLLERPTLAQLDQEMRLKSGRNLDGFIPGEAAAFCVVERAPDAERRGLTAMARIAGVGVDRETAVIGTALPCRAEGLSRAVRKALDGEKIGWVVGDLNGESYRAREWATAQVRLGERIADDYDLWHPAGFYGDVGAASGALLLGICALGFARGCAPVLRALCFCGSDAGERGAVVLAPVVRS